MGYYISYYIKKYWYILVLIILLAFLWFIVELNDIELVSSFDKFNNKVKFEPNNYWEEVIKPGNNLSDLEVGVPYIGTASRPYIPSSISKEEEDEYLRKLKEDPLFVYKKNISWADGSVTHPELEELIELVGYHLNQNNKGTISIVRIPTIEELEAWEKELLFYTDKEGILYLNIYVEESDEVNNTRKIYCETFKLKYDMYGRVTIR